MNNSKFGLVQFIIPTVIAVFINRYFHFGMIPTILVFAATYGIFHLISNNISPKVKKDDEI